MMGLCYMNEEKYSNVDWCAVDRYRTLGFAKFEVYTALIYRILVVWLVSLRSGQINISRHSSRIFRP